VAHGDQQVDGEEGPEGLGDGEQQVGRSHEHGRGEEDPLVAIAVGEGAEDRGEQI